MAYTSVADLKTYLGIDDSVDDAVLTDCVAAATANITTYCGRDFNSSSLETRKYVPTSRYIAYVDDIASTSGLVIATDDDEDGTAETTWASTDYQLEPFQHATPTGQPAYIIRAVGTQVFRISSKGLYTLHVTASWGWPSVPAEVEQAALMLAARLFKRRTSPEGIITNSDFGMLRVGRVDPDVQALLSPYRLIYARY